MSKSKSIFIVIVAYILSISAILFISQILNYSNILNVLIADVIATIIIFIFSVYFRNSSIYDPYWSVIPPVILFYFIYLNNEFSFQAFLLSFSVIFWGVRLTFNWFRGWPGLHHEDWRYVEMRKVSGKYFQFSNFFGIHLFPTFIVFFCCIPMYSALTKKIDIFTFLGFIICFIGVLYEIISDQQLYNFKKNSQGIINSGLWKYSRHPNYYGEILFWWGLYFYGVTYDSLLTWIFAPISMTIMFLFVSIPWIEKKILSTRPEYADYKLKVGVLSPELGFLKKLFK